MRSSIASHAPPNHTFSLLAFTTPLLIWLVGWLDGFVSGAGFAAACSVAGGGSGSRSRPGNETVGSRTDFATNGT